MLYTGVVALMRLAFVGFATDHVAGLFLSFAAALLLGVLGPICPTVWRRHGRLSDLGLRMGQPAGHDLPGTGLRRRPVRPHPVRL